MAEQKETSKTTESAGGSKPRKKSLRALAAAGRTVLSVSFLVPAALTCCAVAVTAANYSPLTFDPSQYEQQKAKVAQLLDEGALTTEEVDESKRTTDTQTAEQKAKAAASSNYGMKAPAGGYADGIYTAKSYGYCSYITVQVVIKGDKIASVKVLSENEDRPYFTKAKAVLKRVVSKQGTNVDTVSGATYSSKGILAAVKKCLVKASKGSKKQTAVEENEPALNQKDDGQTSWGDNGSKGDTGKNEDSTSNKLYADGTWTGTAKTKGYNIQVNHGTEPIVVSVTTKGDKIIGMEVVSHAEDNPYFKWATSGRSTRRPGVLPQILEKQTADVDTVSGATYSSRGLIEAVKDALEQAEAELKKQQEEAKKDDTGKDDSGSSDSGKTDADKGNSGSTDKSDTSKGDSSGSGKGDSSKDDKSDADKADSSKGDSGKADENVGKESSDAEKQESSAKGGE